MAITRDTQKDLGNNGGSATTLTTSYPMGSVSNGLLVVGFLGDTIAGNDDVTSVVWDPSGVNQAFTFIAKYTGPNFTRFLYLYYLLAPTSGTKNIVITCGSSHYIIALAASYANVGAKDVSTVLESAATTAFTATLGSVAANAVVLLVTGSSGNGGLSAGSGTTQVTTDAAFGITALYESNPVGTGGGSINLVENSVSSVVHAGVMASFTLAGGGGGGAVLKAPSLTLTGVM